MPQDFEPFVKERIYLQNVSPRTVLLAAGGSHLKSRAGDLDQTPLDSTSRLQVCLCQAALEAPTRKRRSAKVLAVGFISPKRRYGK